MKSIRDQSLADYVVIAISPALIMTLIGSLIYFLLEVFYPGEYQGRMRWVLSCFVFGSVLVARVAMHPEAAPRAPIYSLVLTVAAWFVLGFFIEYPGELRALSWVINAGLVLLVWWCAKRLTWDCTYINDEVDAGKSGLLQVTGFEKPTQPASPPLQSPPPPAVGDGASDDDKLGWWERFVRYRDAQRKQHTPGAWIIYFSLAALPLFGLFQALIPAEDEARRRYTFVLMAVYIASGLGLLLTTCFLGLRRYLRQRKLRMPAKMVGSWLLSGGVLIAVLLVVGAVLPRPNSETALVDIDPLGSRKRKANDQSFIKDGSGKDKGNPGETQNKKDGPGQGKDSSGGKDTKGEQGGQGKDQKGGSQKDSKDGGQKGGNQKNGSAAKDQKKGDGPKKDGDQKKNDGGSSSDDQAKGDKKEDQKNKDDGSAMSKSKEFFRHLPQMGQLSTVLKWIIFGVLAGLIVYHLMRSGLNWLANFTKWARDLLDSLRAFWERLFGRRETTSGSDGKVEPAAAMARPPRPFSSFRNPFDDGSADRVSPVELVRYSFAALQAWANEHDLGRPPDETPLEFAARVGDEVPALDVDARQLALLYARAVYARGGMPSDCIESLRHFWEKLETVQEQPLSA
jgi:hypothetical protein